MHVFFHQSDIFPARGTRFAVAAWHPNGYPHPLQMKRVLILTAGYGEGHYAAARGLASAMKETGADAEVRDLFLETYGRRHRMTQLLYIECINRAPPLWALAYRALDRTPLMRLIVPALGALRRRLAAVLAEKRPDAVVLDESVEGCGFPPELTDVQITLPNGQKMGQPPCDAAWMLES